MNKSEKVFNIFVTIAVVATGTIFGAWAGIIYSEDFWWIGSLTGGVSAYPLAKIYLRQISKAIADGGSRIMAWGLGAFISAICGIICTLITHVVMKLISMCLESYSIEGSMDFWPLVVLFACFIGGAAGMILGMICSFVYVLVIKGEHRETA